MATTLHRALQNFVYVLEEVVTPTSLTPNDNRFERYDPDLADCPVSSAGVRKYFVEYLTSDPDRGATDVYSREAEHYVRLSIEYPKPPFDSLVLQTIILQDRHDIVKALRDTQYNVGWKDGAGTVNTTGATGIMTLRELISCELVRTNRSIWRLVMVWRFFNRESEA